VEQADIWQMHQHQWSHSGIQRHQSPERHNHSDSAPAEDMETQLVKEEEIRRVSGICRRSVVGSLSAKSMSIGKLIII
jgi:hypothetical protein